MTDKPNPLPERPLVTFALFTYNQEKYIREAIEGAFSQTYEPLEIILSDDCSSDRTFEIMQEMAAAYEGPHEVRVRQTVKNVGTLSHMISVARGAHGLYLIVAAGDDVSLPKRTSIIIPYFASDQVAAISSDDIVIDETGKERSWYVERIEERDQWYERNNRWILGATAAYRSDLFRKVPLPMKPILHEDTVLQEILTINNKKSLRIRDQLVKRRSHENNISFIAPKDTSYRQREFAALSRWKIIAEVMRYSQKVTIQSTIDQKETLLKKYRESGKYYALLSNWPNLSIVQRANLLWLAIGQRDIRTCLPRLFGCRVFSVLKSIRDNKLGI